MGLFLETFVQLIFIHVVSIYKSRVKCTYNHERREKPRVTKQVTWNVGGPQAWKPTILHWWCGQGIWPLLLSKLLVPACTDVLGSQIIQEDAGHTYDTKALVNMMLWCHRHAYGGKEHFHRGAAKAPNWTPCLSVQKYYDGNLDSSRVQHIVCYDLNAISS